VDRSTRHGANRLESVERDSHRRRARATIADSPNDDRAAGNQREQPDVDEQHGDEELDERERGPRTAWMRAGGIMTR
jgi:hypothetical protein